MSSRMTDALVPLNCHHRATSHPEFKKTFVFDATNRKTARLSWYHPDDTVSHTL